MRRPSIPALERDAALLADWLRRTGLDPTPVELEERAPEHLRVFWHHVGWHESFSALDLVHPDAKAGMQRAGEILTAWRKDDGVALSKKKLPSYFRMVEQSGSGESFILTDESQPGEVALKGVVRDETKKLVAIRTPYLKQVASPLIDRALAGMHRDSYCLSIKDPKVFGGTKLLPALGTNLKLLDEGLILRGVKKDRGVVHVMLAFDKVERAIEWVAKLPGVRRLEAPVVARSWNYPLKTIQPVLDAMSEVKRAPSVDDRTWKSAYGRLDGHWLAVGYDEEHASVYVDPADRGVFAALESHGCSLDLTPKPPEESRHVAAEGKAPSTKDIQREAEALSAIVDELCPEHAATKTPMVWEDGVLGKPPSALSVIAEAVGWSPVLADVLPRTPDEGRGRLRALLEGWFRNPWARDTWKHTPDDDVLDHLPDKTRLLRAKTRGTTLTQCFDYLDDSRRRADPPVWRRGSAAYGPVEADARLSNYLFQRILEAAAGDARTAPSNFVPDGGDAVFPKVCPSIVQVAPDVWQSRLGIHFVSDDKLGSFLTTLAAEHLALISPPGRYRTRPLSNAKKLQPSALDGVDGFRMYAQNATSVWKHAVGMVDRWPVWLHHVPRSPLRVTCADEALPVVTPWVEAHGAIFKKTR